MRNDSLEERVRLRREIAELLDFFLSRASGSVFESAGFDGGAAPLGALVAPGDRGREGNGSVLAGDAMMGVQLAERRE